MGEPANNTQKEIYKVVKEALSAAIDVCKPGVRCSEVDAAARKVIRDSGFGDYEHRWATGHQLGYGLHGDPLDTHLELPKGVGQVLGVSGNAGATFIGHVFPRTGYGHLDKKGCEGCDHGKEEDEEDIARPSSFLIVAATPKDRPPSCHGGDKADGPGEGGRNGLDQDIPVTDVGELMADHPGPPKCG